MATIRRARRTGGGANRIVILRLSFGIFAGLIVLRLLTLQILQHGFYVALAADQHQLSQQLQPRRGEIFVRDAQSASGNYPLAANRTMHLLYAVPKQVQHPDVAAHQLAPLVATPEDDLLRRLSKSHDLYEPLQHNLTDDQQTRIKALNITGLFFQDEMVRYYPEQNIGSHLLGFVGYDGDTKVGRYGLEGYDNRELAGQQGFINAQKDASGQIIATAAQFWQPATNGVDLVLTIDRSIQFTACQQLNEAVQKHGADGGSIIILNPKTGAVVAMCGSPDFNPNEYSKVTDVKMFLNPSTQVPYEPGSVFKAFTMAAALDQGKVTPESTYTDTGEVKIASFTIKNSDGQAHGVQTMTQVLEQSLNTGAIYAMRQIGPTTFTKYIQAFGFGQPTHLDLDEASGDITGLKTGKEIYSITGAFGQGLTVTPIQLAAAYGAIANGGQLMQPYVIDRIKKSDGTVVVTKPHEVRQVISPTTAATLSAMLVRVVQNGHGKRAGVPGYFVAGKTGTAQIPDHETGKYLANVTIGTFAGFAPVEDPKFVMVVQLVKPRDVQFAESSAAPLFGTLAKFLLPYYNVPPTTSLAATKP